MSQQEQDELFGKTAREHREAEKALADLKERLNGLGDRLLGAGAVLKERPETFREDKETMLLEIRQIWDWVAKYNDAGIKLAEKKARLEQLSK